MFDRDSEISDVLKAAGEGDVLAGEKLFPLVYGELRSLAARRLAREAPGHTLQPTALVHEAYLRLVKREPTEGAEHPWQGRRHFFTAAAESMRRILVDRARARKSLKRGGGFRRIDIQEVDVADEERPEELLALDDALAKLEQADPVKAELVKMRFFGGLTGEQAALALGVSASTADNYWAYARAWLRVELRGPVRATGAQDDGGE
jgi:RNA polymerase sigma factor (TIGR02999 family)